MYVGELTSAFVCVLPCPRPARAYFFLCISECTKHIVIIPYHDHRIKIERKKKKKVASLLALILYEAFGYISFLQRQKKITSKSSNSNSIAPFIHIYSFSPLAYIHFFVRSCSFNERMTKQHVCSEVSTSNRTNESICILSF